jgi:hypothetical protein
MKTLVILLSYILLSASCATSDLSKTARNELKLQKKAAQQEVVQKTVESGSFLIKMDRLQLPGGGFISLLPSSNYIIVNNGYIRMRVGYIGRSYEFRPITGINLKGKATRFELISDKANGVYEMKIDVEDNGDRFNIDLSVSGDEYCNAIISNIRIETARYYGHLIPNNVQN